MATKKEAEKTNPISDAINQISGARSAYAVARQQNSSLPAWDELTNAEIAHILTATQTSKEE